MALGVPEGAGEAVPAAMAAAIPRTGMRPCTLMRHCRRKHEQDSMDWTAEHESSGMCGWGAEQRGQPPLPRGGLKCVGAWK